MMTEEWLCSRLKLCQLVISPDTAPFNDRNAEEVVINTQKYPEVDYDQSSVFLRLKTYTDTLCEACPRISNLNKQHGDQNIPEPGHVQTDILDHYAEMLCGDILDMAMRRSSIQSADEDMVRYPEKSDNTQIDQMEVIQLTRSNQEKQAESLACEIYNRALEELAMHNCLTGSRVGELSSVVLPKQMDQIDCVNEVHSEPESFVCSSSCQPQMEVDTKKVGDHGPDRPVQDSGSRDQPSGSATYYNTLNGMAQMGSLDYPDAPPSTPLLPGMMKSRASFSRKLKGGLAKEFMPSPPPPTPKDQQVESLPEDKMAETATNNSEFMVRLMRSLSLACVQCRDLDQEEQGTKDEGRFQTGITTVPAYAARLSADIIHWVTTSQPGVNIKAETPVRDLHYLAGHLAEEIILMSIAEVMERKKLQGEMELNSPSSYAEGQMPDTGDRTQVFGNALVPRASPDVPAMEVMRVLSDKIVANTLAQAFSELGVGALQYSSSQQLLGEASEPLGSDTGSNQYPNSYLDTTKCHPITAVDLGTLESRPDYNHITDDTRAGALTAEYSFTESIVDEGLQCSIGEPHKSHLCSQTSIISDRLSPTVLSPRATEHAVVKGIISDTQCHEIQELQCILLWAAASHKGTSVLRLQLPESHIQQQLCSLSLRTQFRGWTVGDLTQSLLQYCEDLLEASRGHCKSSGSLLGHLLLCVD